MSLRAVAQAVVPPILYLIAKRAYRAVWPLPPPPPIVPQYGDLGDYGTFAEAAGLCGKAYEQADVLEKTLELTRGIVAGPYLSQLSIRLLAGVQYSVARTGGASIKIIDLGGALGGSYFALRHFLPVEHVDWIVVELPETAALGREHFASNELSFVDSLEAAGQANLVIAAGSLQFIPDPYAMLQTLQGLAPFLIVDRIALIDRDRIVVQKVHPDLFAAWFPKWYLSRERFLAAISMRCVMEWELPNYLAPLDGSPQELHRGFLFQRQG